MWDVNHHTSISIKSGISFHMDYVGCKFNIKIEIKIRRYEFHMDYVGCKSYATTARNYIL